jgi:hypothetical protein
LVFFFSHSLRWGGALISTFVIVSLTVSFLSLGLSTKHILDGMHRDRARVPVLRTLSLRLGR